MNENPEGTPNPLNPTPQPASTPTPSAPTNVNAAENNATVPPTPTAPASNENIEPITAEQLVEPASQPSAPVAPATPPTPVTPEAPKPATPHPAMHNTGRVVDPMMVRGQHSAPINRVNTNTPQPGTPAHMAQPTVNTNAASPDLGDDADAIIQQLSQNTDQPQVADATAEPKKKKSKTGLIVAATILVLVAIGCAVAAILILNPFAKDDRVPMAIDKLLSGQVPSSIAVSGTISGSSDQVENGVNALDITLNGQFNTADGTNTASATVTAGFVDKTELTFDAEELTTKDSGMFLRFSGVGEALKNINSGFKVENFATESPAENCVTSEDGTTNCVPVEEVTDVVTTCEGEACDALQQDSLNVLGNIGAIADVFNTIDEEWIRIPAENMSSSETSILNNPAQCLTTTMTKLPNYGGDIRSLYAANPFLEYSTENLAITARKDRLYRISINEKLFTNFVNAVKGNELANELLACVSGTATNDGLTTDEVKNMFESYPTVYVEVNDQYLFTRVVFDSSLKNGATVHADLNLSYPASTSVIEPEEYLEINEVMNRMLNDLYGISTDTTVQGDVPPADQPQQ